jgi:hypothetical protein
MCLKEGYVAAGRVADHIVPHKGNYDLFFYGELQSLCYICHNSSKKQLETKGFTNHIGADGWPLDPRHPANSWKFSAK